LLLDNEDCIHAQKKPGDDMYALVYRASAVRFEFKPSKFSPA